MPNEEPLQAAETGPDVIAVPLSVATPTLSGGPSIAWNGGLYDRVVNAIFALPNSFRSALNIVGIRATDLYTLNTALGAAIEQSVVDNLNALRSLWDPEETLKSYAFVRQPQAFPDVRLQSTSPNDEPTILMGIELKGWFALSKEGEPSFRYLVTPAACADVDLLVVFPWLLNEVVSGSPRLLRPFVTEARYAAEQRNHYWTSSRGLTGPASEVTPARDQNPYPAMRDRSNDIAVRDGGSNFGRVARSGIMAAFIAEMMVQPIAGIPLGAWQRFIKIFADGFQEDQIEKGLKALRRVYEGSLRDSSEASDSIENFTQSFESLIRDLAAK